MHIVIIGNGIAANATVSTVREFDQRVQVTMISRDSFPAYYPSALPYYLSGDIPRGSVFLKSIEDYEREKVNLVLGREVTNIDTRNKKVSVGDELVGYDQLVIATGAKPIVPPIQGVDKEGVLDFKVLSDADKVLSYPGRVAVVIGAGVTGIEVAEALRKRGYQVFLIELLSWILSTVFDREPALLLAEVLEEHGIHVLTDEKVIEISGDAEVNGVITDKRNLQCDMVIVAVGVIPEVGLAKRAGLELGRFDGIKVNNQMVTSVSEIYACGDCALSKDVVTGEEAIYFLQYNAIEQAKVVGSNCVGNRRIYHGTLNLTRVSFFDVRAAAMGGTLASLGNDPRAEVVEKRLGANYYRLILRDGILVGAQAIGKPADDMGVFLGVVRRYNNLAEVKGQWNMRSVKSAYPWTYRIMTRYLGN